MHCSNNYDDQASIHIAAHLISDEQERCHFDARLAARRLEKFAASRPSSHSIHINNKRNEVTSLLETLLKIVTYVLFFSFS
jgi:hypothetical protein